MSIIRKAGAVCTGCGKENEITVYRSINTAENPELKEKVKDGSLFLWKCPSCGQTNLMKYETLYQMNSITLHAKAIGNYTLRKVSDTGSLMEKVLIADAGLDDAVIEMCKYITRMELVSKTEDKTKAGQLASAPFHFYALQGEESDRLITLMYPFEGKMTGVNIGYNVYEDCEGIIKRNPHIKPGEGFEQVDAAWLESHIR